MLTCAVPTSLPNTQHWPTLGSTHPVIKEELPEDNSNEYTKEQCNSFFSEGFHSASPSSSSKDSAALSPRSVASGGEPSPTLYDAPPLHSNNHHLDAAFRAEYPYNLLAQADPTFNSRYSPRSIPQESANGATSPKFPRLLSPERQGNITNCQRSPGDCKREGCDEELRDDLDDEPGLRVPAVNSHGKVKTFKCKQCEFVAVTKLSFWEHSKEHIKPEKMLNCPKCPFVTEYKHHLEYHMRNHFGSKPFRCTQCDYSCVNKSMLNSHLKSHSNIYQYRCSDCNYATKYCHSLKLHLRKYRHSPAMVLNHDGTPNPLPIIDVYGTRRGPKMKTSQRSNEQPAPLSPIAGSRAPHLEPLFRHPFGMNLPYGGLLPHPFLFPPSENFTHHEEERIPRTPPPTQPQQTIQENQNFEPKKNETPPPVITSPQCSPPAGPPDALDLSRRENSPPRPTSPDRSSPTTPTTSLKNRRKGRAFKLEPEALRMQHTSTPPPPVVPPPASYECPHCEIVFRDLTMHMIHMGFHGYNEPFMCNKCGERTTDRVSFFIHLGRARHA